MFFLGGVMKDQQVDRYGGRQQAKEPSCVCVSICVCVCMCVCDEMNVSKDNQRGWERGGREGREGKLEASSSACIK